MCLNVQLVFFLFKRISYHHFIDWACVRTQCRNADSVVVGWHKGPRGLCRVCHTLTGSDVDAYLCIACLYVLQRVYVRTICICEQKIYGYRNSRCRRGHREFTLFFQANNHNSINFHRVKKIHRRCERFNCVSHSNDFWRDRVHSNIFFLPLDYQWC